MKRKRGFLRPYLILVILFALLGITDTILGFSDIQSNIFTNIFLTLSFLFFFYNLMALAYFHHHHVETLVFILPAYHIITYLAFTGIGFYLVFNQLITPSIITTLLIITGISALLELIFAIFMIFHTKCFTSEHVSTQDN